MPAVALLVGTGENWPFHCCAAVVNCQIYTPNSAIYSLAVEIYTPDSAIYSLRSQLCGVHVYAIYDACSAFDPSTHYCIFFSSLDLRQPVSWAKDCVGIYICKRKIWTIFECTNFIAKFWPWRVFFRQIQHLKTHFTKQTKHGHTLSLNTKLAEGLVSQSTVSPWRSMLW